MCMSQQCRRLNKADGDEVVVALVADAYHRDDSNANQPLWSELHQLLQERHGERLARFAQRFTLFGAEPQDIVSDIITQFTAPQNLAKFVKPHISDGAVVKYLYGMVRNACLTKIRECDRLLLETEIDPPDSRGTDAEFEQLCWLYQAILQLPPEQRDVMLIDMGWNPLFNAKLKRVPTHGDSREIALFLGVSTSELARRRTRARMQLKQWGSEIDKASERPWIEQAFQKLTEQVNIGAADVRPWHFPMPVARLAISLVIDAREIGVTGGVDLLRTMAELDHLGDYDAALKLADQIETSVSYEELQNRAARTLYTNVSMYLDHMSGEKENAGEYQQAIVLLKEAKRTLKRGLPVHLDLLEQARTTSRADHCRAVLHLGILSRRELEIRRLSKIGTDDEQHELLSTTRSLFREVLLLSDREDTRISATHQLGVCDLLSARLDEAEAAFQLCLIAWDRLERSKRRRMRPEDIHMRCAYEYRRLGHVWAARGEFQKSLDDLQTAMSISLKTGFMRYFAQIITDMQRLLPAHIIPEIHRPKRLSPLS